MIARPGGLRLLVTVTFNPNQLRSHLQPLIALDEVESITLVADVAPPPLDKVSAHVPSRRSRTLLGRAGAKLALCRRLSQRERFDWVLGFNFVPHGFNAQHVARRAHTRSMYHMIGGAREWEGGGWASENGVLGRLPRPSRRVERFLLDAMRRATLVATMGPNERERLLELGFPPEQVVIVPPSTELERFTPARDVPAGFDLVTVGRLVPLKRQEDMLEVVARLRHRHPQLSIAFAGEGPARARLEQRTLELGIDGHVSFLGHVDAIEDVYRTSRIFTLTSDTEGLPIGMLDAMAAGLPVVSTNVGEIATVVRDGENGYVIDVGDTDALAARVDAILSDAELERALGRGARDTVVDRFSVPAVAALYRELLARDATP